MIPKIQSEPRRFDSWQWFIRSTAEFRSTSTFRLFYRSWFRRKEQAPIIPKTAQNIITYINNQHYETDCTRPSDSAKNEILKRMLINWIHFKKLVKQSSAKQQCLYTCVIDRDILDLVSRFSISNVDWNISSAIRPILIGSMMMAHSPLPWIILILFRWEKQLIYVEINVTFTILLPSSCSAEDCYRWTIDIKKQGDLWTDRPNRSVFTIGKLPKIPGHLELNWDNPFQRFKRSRKSFQSSSESPSNSPASNTPKNLARAAVYALGGTLLTTGTANYIRTDVPQIEKAFRDTSHLRIVFYKITRDRKLPICNIA